MDREALLTAQIWDKKIQAALGVSRVMIAILSPSFVRSGWCLKEWRLFSERERQSRASGLLPDDQGLIFPILLYPLDRGRFNSEEQAFVADVKGRQWLDVSSQLPGSPLRPEQLRRLAEAMIDISTEVETKERTLEKPTPATHGVILDSDSRLMWSGSLSPELTYDEAAEYVKHLVIDGYHSWRLPSKRELEALILPSEVLKEADARRPSPLREPFNSQRFGYLHSGTRVKGYNNANYIMNVRNGHVFNGEGNTAFVRAVRKSAARPKPPLGPAE